MSVGKAKRIPGPKSKTKAKKPAAEMPTRNSGSEEDESAAAKPKKGPNRKTKAKSNLKICPPPLFDDSSNDEFNLDASAVEPSSDISLHPESNDRTGKTKKKAVDEEGKYLVFISVSYFQFYRRKTFLPETILIS